MIIIPITACLIYSVYGSGVTQSVPREYKSNYEDWLRVPGLVAEIDSNPFYSGPYVGIGPIRPDFCSLGEIELEWSLGTAAASRVFAGMIAGERKIVKYATDCQQRVHGNIGTEFHPLVIEFRFLYLLKGSGIVPEALFLSPKAVHSRSLITPPRTMQMGMVRNHQATCARHNSEMRFMVQELGGKSVGSYLKGLRDPQPKLYAVESIKITIQLIQLLQKLHSYGIVHNDIHFGNVVFDLKSDNILLIDFEYADFFASRIGSPIEQPRRPFLVEGILSPWQILSQRPGRRDDVYRAIEALANSLSNKRLRRGHDRVLSKELEKNGNPLNQESPEFLEIAERVALHFKTQEPLFRYSEWLESECCSPNLGFRDQLGAQSVLEEIVTHIRAYDHPDHEPDYEFIVERLTTVLKMLD